MNENLSASQNVINSPQQSVKPTPPPQSAQQSAYHTLNNNISSENQTITREHKPRIFNIIQALLVVISLFYFQTAVTYTGVVVVMHKASSEFSVSDMWLKNFPLYGIIPILASYFMIWFLYCSFKTKSGSFFGYLISLKSLVLIVLPFGYLSQIIMNRIIYKFEHFGLENVTPIPIGKFDFGINPFVIFFLLTLVLLIIYRKKFSSENLPLSKKYKIVLIAILTLVVIPINILIGYSYIQAMDTNYGYTSVSNKVDYHVYKPAHLPEKIDYATKYELIDYPLADQENTIAVSFFTPVIKYGEIVPNLITLRQVKVEPNFDLLTFSTEQAKKQEDIPDFISVTTASDNTAYWYTRKTQNRDVDYLVFKTTDNILIYLTSTNDNIELLVEIAEALE